MISKQATRFELRKADSYWTIAYEAMASPCEILVRCNNESEAEELASLACLETERIEQKFSRYRDNNLVYAINHSNGKAIPVDEEMSQLLDYAGKCYDLSDGLFDITSGVLRKAWIFKGEEVNPDRKLISSLLKLVGWEKVKFSGEKIQLLPGMEIDFGGIGKEYAVDKVTQLLFETMHRPLMVNFGGDIRAIHAGGDDKPWEVGIEDPGSEESAVGMIQLSNGAVTTSGDSRRYCYVKGKRLGHILNPKTGWPVTDSPRSVTVIADYCMEAGLISTLGMLQGGEAETFLAAQGVTYHCIR